MVWSKGKIAGHKKSIETIPVTNQHAFISRSLGHQVKAQHDDNGLPFSNVATQYWFSR